MKDEFLARTARDLIDRNLQLLKLGNTHQRAMLVGLRDALDWVLGIGEKHVIEQLLDGRPILPNNETIYEAHARQRTEQGTTSRRNRSLICSPWSGVTEE